MDWSKRSTQSEIMDDFQGDIQSPKKVHEDINRANQMMGGNSATVKAVAMLISKYPQEEFVFADMGCGDGAMLRILAEFCRKEQLKATFIGIDLSEKSLLLAKEASKAYPEISYVEADILHLNPADFKVDIIVSTLTMHHFTDKEITSFLQKFAELAGIGIVINDLHRSALSYYLFKGFSRIFIKTKVARHDGALSIRRAFVKSDLVGYSKQLPSMVHTIRWKWAFRYVWVMQLDRLR